MNEDDLRNAEKNRALKVHIIWAWLEKNPGWETWVVSHSKKFTRTTEVTKAAGNIAALAWKEYKRLGG